MCFTSSRLGQMPTPVPRPVLKPQAKPSKAVPKTKTSQEDWKKPEAERATDALTETRLEIETPTDGVRSYFASAVELIKAKKLEEALAVFQKAEKIEPKMFEVQLNLGVLLAILRKMPEAVSALQKAASINPKSSLAHGYLCQALAESDRRSQAVDECREAVRLDPDDTKFSVLLAQLYAGDERVGEAMLLLESGYLRSQNNIALLGTLGDLYYDNGEFARAAEMYEKIATRWPKVGVTYLRLSGVYALLDRQTEATAAARKFYEIVPGSFLSQLNLGHTLQDAGFFDESIEFLLKATTTNPANGDAYLILSESYEAIGDRENTVQSLRHAYKYLPPTAQIAFRLGKALTGYGKMAEAVKPLERANSLEPNQLEIMGQLGLAYFESHDFDRAIEILSKADQLSPNNPVISMFLRVSNGRKQILSNFDQLLDYVRKNPADTGARSQLASAYRSKGMLREAENEHLAIIKLAPGEVSGYSNLGIFYVDTGQIEKSLVPYQKAVDLSNHHVAYMNLSSALEKLGRLDEAIVAAKKSVEIKSTLIESRLALGDLLLKKGNRDEALREFQAAFDLNSGNPAPNFRLAWFYLRVGNKEGSLRHYGILRGIAPGQLLYLERSLRAHFGPLR